MAEPLILLRDVGPQDLDRLRRWESDGSVGTFNDFGGEYDATGVRGGTMIVERRSDGEAIGAVSWHEVRYGPNTASTALNIGINLVPSARGRGFGAEAQRLLALRLFATTDVNRVEASTDVENVAEQRALAAAGFTREGVLRGAQFRAGRWRDLVVFSVLRSEAAGSKQSHR